MALALLGIIAQFGLPSASAHESRDVAGGKYQFRVGFLNEPVYQGLDNAVFLAICTGSCTSNPDGSFTNGVTGAFDTIKVEISSNGQTMQLGFKAVPRMPGRYNAQFIPTRVGDYTFRVFGTLGSDTIDEKFRSSPTTFDSVEPVTAIQFPDKPGFAGNQSGAVSATPAGSTTTAAASTASSPAATVSGASTTAATASTPANTATGAAPAAANSNSAEIQQLNQKITDQQRQLDSARSDASSASLIGYGGLATGLLGIILAGLAFFFARQRGQTTPRPRREIEGG